MCAENELSICPGAATPLGPTDCVRGVCKGKSPTQALQKVHNQMGGFCCGGEKYPLVKEKKKNPFPVY